MGWQDSLVRFSGIDESYTCCYLLPVDDHQVSDNTFGLFIAYVLPGLTVLHGLPGYELPNSWWSSAASSSLTFPVLVTATMQAIAAGLTVSAVRWLTVDTLHHRTGISSPTWNLASLQHGIDVLQFLIQIHYRYYKFYANMVVALITAELSRWNSLGWKGISCYLLLTALFFVASRDALQKYYSKSAVLFGSHLPNDFN